MGAVALQPVPWPRRLRRAVRARLILLLITLLGLLPFGLSCRLGAAFGRLVYLVARREREKALAHLRLAFPDEPAAERRVIARESFAHLGRCAIEIAQERSVDRRLSELVELPSESLQVLRGALSEQKGAVVVTGHVGNWELLARRVARENFHIAVVARELNVAALTDAMDAYRARGGVTTLWRGRPNTTREMLKVFRANGLLGLLIDQDTKVQSTFVQFFGVEAATPKAAGDLCARTGAPLLAAFIHREGGRHRIAIERIDVPRTGVREADSLALTVAATRAIEEAIRRTPEQWVWMHERWKTRPRDAAEAGDEAA